ncbi:hypothetical protein ACA910_012847 [Epithemia clementina (nom. ined.)]
MPRQPHRLIPKQSVAGVVGKEICNPGEYDIHLFGPYIGNCIHCLKKQCLKVVRRNLKKFYQVGQWPIYVQGVELQCRHCNKMCLPHNYKYIQTLLPHLCAVEWLILGSAVGIPMELVVQQRMNVAASILEYSCCALLEQKYNQDKSFYYITCKKMVALGQAKGYEDYPPFPEDAVPKAHALMVAFLEDYIVHRDALRREQKALTSTIGLAVDDQSAVLKRVKQGESNDGMHTSCIIGDHGLVLWAGVVPSSAECHKNGTK